MSLMLSLSCTDLNEEDLQQLTQELCKSIASETQINAETPSGSVLQGTKGDTITIGVIALAFLTSGSAVALFEVFKAYFIRQPSLTIKMTKADGTPFEMTAQNIKLEQIQALLTQIDNTTH